MHASKTSPRKDNLIKFCNIHYFNYQTLPYRFSAHIGNYDSFSFSVSIYTSRRVLYPQSYCCFNEEINIFIKQKISNTYSSYLAKSSQAEE